MEDAEALKASVAVLVLVVGTRERKQGERERERERERGGEIGRCGLANSKKSVLRWAAGKKRREESCERS